jgi:hypothetical protein
MRSIVGTIRLRNYAQKPRSHDATGVFSMHDLLHRGDDNELLFQPRSATVDRPKAQIDLVQGDVTLRFSSPVMTGFDKTASEEALCSTDVR